MRLHQASAHKGAAAVKHALAVAAAKKDKEATNAAAAALDLTAKLEVRTPQPAPRHATKTRTHAPPPHRPATAPPVHALHERSGVCLTKCALPVARVILQAAAQRREDRLEAAAFSSGATSRARLAKLQLEQAALEEKRSTLARAMGNAIGRRAALIDAIAGRAHAHPRRETRVAFRFPKSVVE